MKFTILGIGNFIRVWSKVSEKVRAPFARVFLLDERRERACVKNMEAYLAAVAPVFTALKKSGATDTEIQSWTQKLHVPVVEATLELLIARRKEMTRAAKGKGKPSEEPEPTP
ncbi:MAG: hypothetical protein JSR48_04350 [Verrucomicrobia bacterium]|nr:hypothetical protein [Verrucomicrobiota bacterium]